MSREVILSNQYVNLVLPENNSKSYSLAWLHTQARLSPTILGLVSHHGNAPAQSPPSLVHLHLAPTVLLQAAAFRTSDRPAPGPTLRRLTRLWPRPSPCTPSPTVKPSQVPLGRPQLHLGLLEESRRGGRGLLIKKSRG